MFVPTERVLPTRPEEETGGAAYGMTSTGAEPFSHDRRAGSFDAFLKVYGIEDRGLDRLALIVRGAITASLELTPQSPATPRPCARALGQFPDEITRCSSTGW